MVRGRKPRNRQIRDHPGTLKAVISDFGGVLTTPITTAFEALHQRTGLSPKDFGLAMKALADAEGRHPLYELECGRITEAEFNRLVSEELTRLRGEPIDFGSFGELLFENLHPNAEIIELMAELRANGHRMALLTNNVREWEPRWRSMAPIDEIFELVVDSAFVNCRKPDPEIYEITLDRLGLGPSDCLFVDDMEINCQSAATLGIHAVHFRDNHQAVTEIRSLLG